MGHVGDVVLAVGIERDDKVHSESARVPAEKFESGFERGSPAPVLRMPHRKYVVPAGENGRSRVARTVVDDEDFGISGKLEAVDHAFEARRFVIGPDKERDVRSRWKGPVERRRV